MPDNGTCSCQDLRGPRSFLSVFGQPLLPSCSLSFPSCDTRSYLRQLPPVVHSQVPGDRPHVPLYKTSPAGSCTWVISLSSKRGQSRRKAHSRVTSTSGSCRPQSARTISTMLKTQASRSCTIPTPHTFVRTGSGSGV